MLRQTLDAAARVSPRFRRLMMKTVYESLVVIDREREITYMNYGYSELDGASGDLPLREVEQENRYCIQLYHHLAAAIDLTGKEVIEVGSGRGGGASYVARYMKPRSMIGIDFSKKAIEFCRHYYSVAGLSFSQGDAENLPLADGSADAVINLESSHCYSSMTRFLSEVHRVLRNGGYFLFSDHRDHNKIDLLRKQFKDSGFGVVAEKDITNNVVRALELDNDRKERLIERKCPRVLRREAEEFAAMKGTRTFETFKSGYSRYLSFVLHKSQPVA